MLHPKIELIQADITRLPADAIVNAANNALMGGGGVDGAIHRAAGREFTEACRQLKGCATGQSKIVRGFNLPASYVILTVGPVWHDGTGGEEHLLASCYTTALALAAAYQLKTIAFPCISTGAYRFPFDKAAVIAYTAITNFLDTSEHTIEKVSLVCYHEKDLRLYQRAIQHL